MKRALLLLPVLAVLAYGWQLGRLGLYWDDWLFLWAAANPDPAFYQTLFAASRPLTWLPAYGLARLLPPDPLAYHLAALLVRALGALAFWDFLRQLWPRREGQALGTAVLFLLYPGFSQQAIALVYLPQHFLPLFFLLVSLALSLRSLRDPARHRIWRLAALVCQAAGTLQTEYLLGLELLRGAAFWLVLRELRTAGDHPLRSLLRLWTPYLLLHGLALLLLAVFYTAGGYDYYPLQPGGTPADPGQWTLGLLLEPARLLLLAGLAAWIEPLRWLSNLTLEQLPVALAAGLLSGWIAWRLLSGVEEDSRESFRQALGLGVLGLLAGRLPAWLAGLPLDLGFSWDRLLLPCSPGAALLAVGLVGWTWRNAWQRRLALVLLVGLAAAGHPAQQTSYLQDWQVQQQLLAQLRWRVPVLAPGTLVVGEAPPLRYETDNSLTAPINWLYFGPPGQELSAAVLFPSLRLGGDKLAALDPGTPVNYAYAGLPYRGRIDAPLVFYLPESGCLKVFDRAYAYEAALWQAPPELQQLAFLADSAAEEGKGPPLPAAWPADPDPPRMDWCRAFQQAELARARADWPAILRLYDQVQADGLTPLQPLEWLPFIEGLARSGRLAEARSLSQPLGELSCPLWTGPLAAWSEKREDCQD